MPLYQTPAQKIVVNVKTDYGAKGDAKTVTDGAMTNASATLTSATAAFTAADVGKQVSVMSARSTAMRYSGKIVSVTNATTVIVSPAPTLTTSAQTLQVSQGRSVADGVTTANSTTVTSATAAFAASDVGKQITVTNAAATALNTTISGFTNATTVTLAASATRTCSGVQVVYGTDDTTAIQNALNFVAITTNPYTTVYLPEGTYLTQQSASGLGGLIIYGNSTIRGDGWATIIRAIGGATSVASGLLEINPWDAGSSDPSQNLKNIVIADMQFQQTTVEDGFLQGMECITTASVTDLTIRNCKFSNMRSDAIYLGNGTHVATGERHNQRIKILDCVVDGVNWENRQGISLLDGDDVLIQGCSFWNTTRNDMPGAIDIEPNSQAANPICRNIVISDNSFYYVGGNSGNIGITFGKSNIQYLTPQQGITIIGNTFWRWADGQTGVLFQQSQYPQEASLRNDVIIADNQFLSSPAGANPGTGTLALQVDGVKGIDVHDNLFNGIYVGVACGFQMKSMDVSFRNNVFRECGWFGDVFQVTNTQRLTIADNLFDKCGDPAGTNGIICNFKNGAGISQPTSIVATPSTTGGTLGAGTRSYRLSSIKDNGLETLAATAVTAVTSGTTASVTVTFVPDILSAGTRVYGRTGGSELLMTTLGPEVATFTDTGAITPSGALPAADTTARGASTGVTFSGNTVQQGGASRTTKIANLVANHQTVYSQLIYENNVVPTGSLAITPFTEMTKPGKAPVRAASTANVALPPGGTTLTVDGVTMANGDRVLLKDQTTLADRGVYVVDGIGTSVILTRSLDSNTGSLLNGFEVTVTEGTLNASTKWVMLPTANPIVVGTTQIGMSRIYPEARGSRRDPWDIGTNPPFAANMDRALASSAVTLPTAATTRMTGGLVLQGGITYSNINFFCTTAGATLTIHWLALARQSDRLAFAHTANSTTTPTINTVVTRAFVSPLLMQEDLPVYVCHAFAATTGSAFAASPAAGTAILNFQTPILVGNSSTTPTTTVPSDFSTTFGAPAAGQTQSILYWLS